MYWAYLSTGSWTCLTELGLLNQKWHFLKDNLLKNLTCISFESVKESNLLNTLLTPWGGFFFFFLFPWFPLSNLLVLNCSQHFHALEKEMATHSSVLAWRIPGTAEPGGLPSMGLHRVRHDWNYLVAAATKLTFLWNCSRGNSPLPRTNFLCDK